MSVNWTAAVETGGCPVTGYSVYRDDGVTGIPSIEVDSSQKEIPTLRMMDIPFSVSDLGKMFTFRLYVFNREGETRSSDVTYLFATIPDTPTLAPTVSSYSATSASL